MSLSYQERQRQCDIFIETYIDEEWSHYSLKKRDNAKKDALSIVRSSPYQACPAEFMEDWVKRRGTSEELRCKEDVSRRAIQAWLESPLA